MKYLSTIAVLFLVIVLNVSEGIPSDAIASDDSIAEVGAFSGKVFVVRDGEKLEVAEGTKLRTGDRIVTDAAGTVKIRHRDGSIMYIGTSSSFIIMAPMKFSLLQGTLRADALGRLEVETLDTPDIAVSTNGGEFIVRRSPQGVEVVTLSNELHIGANNIAQGIYMAFGPGKSPILRSIANYEAAELFPDVRVPSSGLVRNE